MHTYTLCIAKLGSSRDVKCLTPCTAHSRASEKLAESVLMTKMTVQSWWVFPGSNGGRHLGPWGRKLVQGAQHVTEVCQTRDR